jgi:hypothetical protein
MSELKDYVQKLVELDKQEEKYKNIINDLKKEKDNISENIITFLEKNNITDKDILYGESKIKYSKNKVQDGITKKLIQDRLKIFLKNDNLALEATNFIYSDRNSIYKTSLKISSKK